MFHHIHLWLMYFTHAGIFRLNRGAAIVSMKGMAILAALKLWAKLRSDGLVPLWQVYRNAEPAAVQGQSGEGDAAKPGS